MTNEQRGNRQPDNTKDVPTEREQKEKTAKGTERQIEQAEEKDRVTGAW